IVGLLSTDFTKMVIIAILIAMPISYKISENWLSDFAVRIDLQWWYFISGAIIALAISWFTIGYQAFKSANINPADCLRNE
ncbi:MAG: ABC transporter permease, partial [Bacteroidetes bacterium]|nr:ABC transporter permease [Bacteroidota bacterium]